MDLRYKNEKPLFVIAAILAGVFWTLLLLGTIGLLLLYLLIGYVAFLFAHSAFISYLQGTGVKITEEQYPDLHQKLNHACARIELAQVPDAYILRTDVFNALATKFLRRHFIVLFSDVIDALEDAPDAVDFYIGHELGHIQRGHIKWGVFLAPALLLPWLGAAYRRAQEYTCDRYGAHCTNSEENIVKALSVIAAGNSRARTLNASAYLKQIQDSQGFWMSFNELTSDYPWLTKRMASAIAFKRGDSIKHPTRHWFAWVLTFFIPRFGLGGGGGIIGLFIIIAIIGILAAVAIPQYENYLARTAYVTDYAEEAMLADPVDTDKAYELALSVRSDFETFVLESNEWPLSFTDLGYGQETLYSDDGSFSMDIYPDGIIGVLLGEDEYGYDQYLFTEVFFDENDQLYWTCYSDNYYYSLPADCE